MARRVRAAGSLQYELIREGEGWVLNTHIPAEGAMGLDAVRASLARARETMQAAYPEVGPLREAVCHSWLFDRRLDVLLPTLAATSRLQAALLDMWRGGGHLAVGSGRLVFS